MAHLSNLIFCFSIDRMLYGEPVKICILLLSACWKLHGYGLMNFSLQIMMWFVVGSVASSFMWWLLSWREYCWSIMLLSPQVFNIFCLCLSCRSLTSWISAHQPLLTPKPDMPLKGFPLLSSNIAYGRNLMSGSQRRERRRAVRRNLDDNKIYLSEHFVPIDPFFFLLIN